MDGSHYEIATASLALMFYDNIKTIEIKRHYTLLSIVLYIPTSTPVYVTSECTIYDLSLLSVKYMVFLYSISKNRDLNV